MRAFPKPNLLRKFMRRHGCTWKRKEKNMLKIQIRGGRWKGFLTLGNPNIFQEGITHLNFEENK
ncbi:hypothetical protein CR513_24000, partial [Mucuna pruriens]